MVTLLALFVGLGSGQQVHATLTPPPQPLIAGHAWNATLVVRPQPRSAPRLTARPVTGKQIAFRARRVGHGRYKVRLVLPRTGRWRISARIGRSTKPLRTVTVSPLPPPTSPLPGGTAFRVCGGARQPYLQYGLALGFGSAWVACREQGEVQRIDVTSGQVLAHIRVRASVSTVSAGEGAVWAITLGGSTLYRIDPQTNRVAAEISLGGRVPYLWAGAGAVWAADDDNNALIRVDPGSNQRVMTVPVGNGAAGFAFDGSYLWVLNHRENTLDRINPADNVVYRANSAIAPPDTAAAERITFFGGALWVTGRGIDLLRVSTPDGTVLGQTEIGGGGIAVVSDAANLWMAAADADADRRGDPIASAVLELDQSGAVTRTVAPTRRLFADGLAAADGQVWVFDAVAGLLVRLPA
ncbi:MAG: hypothetical protein ABI896_03425 [Actinomycetota bacterium]